MNPHLKTSPQDLIRFEKDVVYQGRPEAIYEAGDWQVISELLAECNANKTGVTFCGSQTSMTGSSVADSGVVVSLTSRSKIIDIWRDKNGQGFVKTEPGVILSELKKAVLENGLYYPPDPTSYREAQVGATVATNATGEETFRYGPTRLYVHELEVLKANGEKKVLTRKNPLPQVPYKNTAGYWLDGEDIDSLIGSEGTLALIKSVTLKVLDNSHPLQFVLVLPFPDFKKTLKAVTQLATDDKLKPVALELIGPGASEYFKKAPDCPAQLQSHAQFLYIKDDARDESEKIAKIELWFEKLNHLYQNLECKDLIDQVFLADTDTQLLAIRNCRHYIPAKVNEEFFPFTKQGGGKIGTDWWVPLQHIEEMMLRCHQDATASGLPFVVFAHIGNGHPHWNFLTRNAQEYNKAKLIVMEHYKRAVQFGGGVAGEHGIGKIKRDLIKIQHSSETLNKMITLKNHWDPNWILGQGNILARP